MATTYYLSNTNSDLSGGADFSKKLLPSTETANTINFSVAKTSTETSYAWTEPGVPGTSGMTGDYTVEVYITVGNANMTVAANIHRVNSSGVVQSSATAASAVTATAGLKTFNWSSQSLGTWAAGDRLRVDYIFTVSGHQAQSLTIQTGTTDTEVVTPWTLGQDFIKEAADTENIDETLDRRMKINRQTADTENIDEELDKKRYLNRELADVEDIDEVLARILGFNKETADIEDIAESLDYSKTMLGVTDDTENISEALDKKRYLNRELADTENIVEALDRARKLARQAADIENIGEALDRRMAMARESADTEDIVETLYRALGSVKETADVVNITESLDYVLVVGVQIFEMDQPCICERAIREADVVPPNPAASKAYTYLYDNAGNLELRIRYPDGTDHAIDTQV